ncbi:unnamed protein product [Rhodiola kirilowii]
MHDESGQSAEDCFPAVICSYEVTAPVYSADWSGRSGEVGLSDSNLNEWVSPFSKLRVTDSTGYSCTGWQNLNQQSSATYYSNSSSSTDNMVASKAIGNYYGDFSSVHGVNNFPCFQQSSATYYSTPCSTPSLFTDNRIASTSNGDFSSVNGVNNFPCFQQSDYVYKCVSFRYETLVIRYYLSFYIQDPEAIYQNLSLLDLEFPPSLASTHITNNYNDADFPSHQTMNNLPHTMPPGQPDDQIRSQIDNHNYNNLGKNHVVEDDIRASSPQAIEDDGYNWRKYGQKQVKGSDYPRSYYKCTHPNCEARKKVERAFDGYITEIIYKCKHNHPRLHPNRQVPLGSASIENETRTGEASSYRVKTEIGSVWRNMNPGENSHGHDKCLLPVKSAGTAETSSPLRSPDAEDDNNEETDSKRRRIDDDDKIMVQVESEVDILDDGYRWRKYGQKVVKGNPNPRSYYKCTTAGCSVRKHVERDAHNIKLVITTYEGKHNHEVPTTKNSGPNKSVGHLSSVQSQSSPTSLTRSAAIMPKLEMPDQFSPPYFEWNPYPSNEFLTPGSLGNFGNGVNFGASSTYALNFPMTHSHSTFGLNTPHSDIQNLDGMTSYHAQNLAVQTPLTLGSLNSAVTPFDFKNYRGVSQLVYPPDHGIDRRHIIPKQEENYETFDGSSSSQVHLHKASPLPSDHG